MTWDSSQAKGEAVFTLIAARPTVCIGVRQSEACCAKCSVAIVNSQSSLQALDALGNIRIHIKSSSSVNTSFDGASENNVKLVEIVLVCLSLLGKT